jgi:FkbM family methyltransferase
MANTLRSAPFITVASNHGTMIINRNDYHMVSAQKGHGVGFQILNTSCYDQDEVFFILELLKIRRKYYGDGVTAIDCGANYGVHTIEWARLMHNWGHVFSFEAQEKIFYALAGNIIMNNCLNVTARNLAVGKEIGEIHISEPNYLIPGSYGSYELKHTENSEFIGQNIDYNHPNKIVSMISLDSISLNRIDLIKIDVEGMEEDVLLGAIDIIKN